MILKNLDLTNFGIIKNANLEFRKGWNLLSGPTGQGKSTALKGFAYLLIDHTPKTIEDLLNWDADQFKAKAIWDYEGIPFDYQAEFLRKGNKSERELHIGSEPSPFFASDATKKLAEYFDPSLCRAAIISFQNESDLVTSDPAKRRDLLKKIYDLNFESQLSLLKIEIETLDKKDREIDSNILIARTRIAGYKIETLVVLPFDAFDYKIKQELLEKLNNERMNIEKVTQEYDQIKADIHEKQLWINSNKVNRKETETIILQSNAQIFQYKNTLAADSFYGKINKLQEDLKGDFEKLKREFELELGQIILSRLFKFDDAEMQRLRKERQDVAYDLVTLKKKIQNCKDGICPTCGKVYEQIESADDEKEVKNHESCLVDLDNLIDIEVKKQNAYEEAKEDHRNKINRQEMLQSRIENEVKMIAQKKTALQAQLEAEEKNIVQLKEAIKLRIEVESQKLIAAIAKQQQIDSAIEEKELEIRSLKVRLPENRPELNEQVKTQICMVEDEIRNYDSITIKNKMIEERNISIEKNKKSDEEKLAKLLTLKATNLQEIENHKSASQIYKVSFPNYVIGDMIADIETGVNSFLDKTYEGRYHITIREVKTGLSIVYGPRDKDISTVASGGEVDLFNIGLKISFCKLSGMKVLILDEVDKYFNSDLSINTFRVIDDMYKEGEFDQIFVISHNDDVKDAIEQFGAKVFDFQKGVVTSY